MAKYGDMEKSNGLHNNGNRRYCYRLRVLANRYVTEFLIDECRGGQELILAALKLFQKLFKKVCTNPK